MGLSKYSVMILLALAVVAGLWIYGRSVFKGATKWVLWALAAFCACAGVIALLGAEGSPLAFLGALALWVFAAYLISVAKSLRKKS